MTKKHSSWEVSNYTPSTVYGPGSNRNKKFRRKKRRTEKNPILETTRHGDEWCWLADLDMRYAAAAQLLLLSKPKIIKPPSKDIQFLLNAPHRAPRTVSVPRRLPPLPRGRRAAPCRSVDQHVDFSECEHSVGYWTMAWSGNCSRFESFFFLFLWQNCAMCYLTIKEPLQCGWRIRCLV